MTDRYRYMRMAVTKARECAAEASAAGDLELAAGFTAKAEELEALIPEDQREGYVTPSPEGEMA